MISLTDYTKDERLQIVRRYKKLLRLCSGTMSRDDLIMIRHAFNYAVESYKGKYRKSGEPYIFHPVAVAMIVVEDIGLTSNAIVAALLHDAYIRSNEAAEEIASQFGPQVGTILKGMSKITGLYVHNLAYQTENFINLFLTITDDIRSILLKLADRLHNMRMIYHFEPEKQLKIATECRSIYAPIAHRLGLYNIKTEMEELSLKIIHPEVYAAINRKIVETRRRRNKYIDTFIAPVKKELDKIGIHFTIKSRVKSINSIWNKMQIQQVDFDEVYDLFAVRIIIKDCIVDNEKTACWNVYSIVTNLYKPNPDRLRDWISTPKSSGYESLHTTVLGPENHWVEVQIRTQRMDDIAEKGHAAHWKYKEAGKESEHELWIRQLRDLLELKNQAVFELIQPAKPSQSDFIYLFTPQGDIKKLESGATVLDFAFSIHTSLGETCTGARVNGKIVPIKYVLQNGDRVEIITSKNQTPKTDWLNYVSTNRSKQKIKRALKDIKYRQSEIGKEMLERKLSQLKLDFNEENLLKILNAFKLKTTLDLYEAIADEKIEAGEIKEIFFPKKPQPVTPEKASLPETVIKTGRVKKEDILIIGDRLQQVDYKLARCCNPIMGDEIFGFVTIDRGIQVHRVNCPNAAEMLSRYPYRIIRAKWDNKSHSESFLADILVTGIDRIGMVNSLSKVVTSDMKVNMRSFAVESNDGIFHGHLQVYISNLAHLDLLIKRIEKVKGVLKARRADESVL